MCFRLLWGARVDDQVCNLAAVTLGDSLLSYLSGPVASLAQAVAKQQDVGHDGFGLVVALVHAGVESLAG